MKIDFQFVTKRYGGVRALDNMSFSIDPGLVVAVLGVNGAGKTTLLRCLSSVAAPSRGRILFDDQLFLRSSLDLRRRLAFLPDTPVFFPQHTPLRHIGMVLRVYGLEADAYRDRVFELLSGFDLLPLIDTPIANLSRGQAYKAALTALMAVDPELLLLDEPFASGMDPNGITLLKREARASANRGHTIIYTTQILDVVETLSDRVCVIDHGQIRHYAPLAELQAVTASGDGGVLERLFMQLRESAR